MSLTKVSYSMIQGEAFNVLDFGADPTGVASSLAAFNAAVANGGTVYVPSGTYKLNGKVSMTTDGTTLWLAADTTLIVSGVVAQQSPWGSQIDITGDNCAVIGSGPSSLIQNDGSYSNMVTFFHQTGAYIANLTIDGDKANLPFPTTDDSFGIGVFFLADTGFAVTTDQQGIIENCTIKNCINYAVNAYGDQANGTKILNNNFREIGQAGVTNSVGAGISVSKEVSDMTIVGNVIKNCKQNGIFIGSAGDDGAGYVITGNNCHQNGESGIAFKEQTDFFSQAGKGLYNIVVAGNTCWGNVRSGIEFNADTLGYLSYITITGNTCQNNTLYGIRVASTNTFPNGYISEVTISGNNCAENGTNISVNEFVRAVEGYTMPFTPAIRGTSTAGVGTYVTQDGSYVKNGSIVTFQIVLDWSAHTGTGNIEITGFPYPSANSEPTPVGWVWANGLTITGQATFGIAGNQTYGALGAINNGVYSAVAMDSAASLRLNGFYFTTT
jgi:hypothetical protein